jgi:hypothetical protein
VNFYRNSTHSSSLNFSSNPISNLEKFLEGNLFLISISFDPYFIWNFCSPVSPPFDQISLNLFKTDLNKSKILLFNWARPTFSFLGRPTHAHARPTQAAASLPPMPADRPVPPVSTPLLSTSPTALQAPLVSDTTAWHYCRGPPISLSPPPLFGRQHAHGARRLCSPVLGRCRSGAAHRSAWTPSPARAPLPPRVGPVSCPPPPPCLTRPLPKRSQTMTPCLGPFSLLHAHSEQPAANPIAVRPSPLKASFPSPEFRPQRHRRSLAR